jgi:hypothetical protein
LPLFTLHHPQHPNSLALLQLALFIFNLLQLLKYPIDLKSSTWLGSPNTAIFYYLDPAYYLVGLTEFQTEGLVVALIVMMNVFWEIQVVLFVLGVKYTAWMVVIRRALFLLFLHVMLVPFFRVILGYSLSHSDFTVPATPSRPRY